MTAKDLLKSVEGGVEIMKDLAKIRITLIVNFNKRIRAFLGTICFNPCFADSYLEGETILVN